MKFGYINAKPEQLWHWFKFQRGGGTPCSLELRLVTSDELIDLPKEMSENPKAYRVFVAENWLRDFKGVTDANGAEVPNTFETRLAVLNHPAIWPWVCAKFVAASDLESEGKGDSGSAS